jgi:hypothetical protein
MTTAGFRVGSGRRNGFLLTVSAVAALGGFLFGFNTGVVAIAFTFALVPETKGRSLEEIEEEQARGLGRRRILGVVAGGRRIPA